MRTGRAGVCSSGVGNSGCAGKKTSLDWSGDRSHWGKTGEFNGEVVA